MDRWMKKISSWLQESAYTAPLSPACRMCAKGQKMVVLVTGRCTTGCYYCPLSEKKKGKDRIFADEWELATEHDTNVLLKEALAIKAGGAGITGGDPLLVWHRTYTYIRLLKATFGDDFHIHLYTSGLHHADRIPDLVKAGLDEIRFHPLPSTWASMTSSPLARVVATTSTLDVACALEVPVIPGMAKELLSLITWADAAGLSWVNLNELEFSEQNCEAFLARGYDVKDDCSAAVAGSQQTAYTVLKHVSRRGLSVGVHYCSVSFKDRVQLRNRIKRRAQTVARPADVITADGTLLKGVIISPNPSLAKVASAIRRRFKVPAELLRVDLEKHRLEIAAWVLETLAPQLDAEGYRCYLVEEYPTADRLEVERISLPPHHSPPES
jgi:hypothetical protein